MNYGWDASAEHGSEEVSGELDMNLLDENAARERPKWAEEGHYCKLQLNAGALLERTVDLTPALAGDLVDELARGYSQPWFQSLVQQCAQECCHDQMAFLMRLQDIAFEVQRPVLENWGFEGNEQGLFDMTSIFREYTDGCHRASALWWLQERLDACLM